MSNALVTLLFEGLLAVLLAATIGYCARLIKRIRQMQDSRGELAEMIGRFDSATGRATAAMAELQTVSKKITDALQLKIEKANFLADDLAFLIEKSAKLAAQLEEAKRQPKPEAPKPEPKPFFEAGKPAQFIKHKLPPVSGSEPYKANAAGNSTTRTNTSLEAVLQRLAAGAMADEKPASGPAPRTDAERELLEALKSGR